MTGDRRANRRSLPRTSGYLYILRDPSLPNDVVKIGRTVDPVRRLSEYPKGCWYITTHGAIADCHSAESEILRMFRSRYARYKGLEYFRGDARAIERDFREFCTGDPSPMMI